MKLFLPALLLALAHGAAAYDALATCHPQEVDVTFLIDASGSIHEDNFILAKNFVATMANQMVISRSANSAQVAFIKFTQRPTKVFDLNTFHDKTAMLAAIHATTYHGGGTHIGDAIEYVVDHEYVPSAGDRGSAGDVLIVLTDGQDEHSNTPVADAAAAANRKNIITWAIGVGPDTDHQELLTIANGRADHVKHIDNYINLTTIYEFVCNAILNSTQPCLNGGRPECLCPPGWTGEHCETAINRCPPSHVDIVNNSHTIHIPFCGPHGTCHYEPLTGSYCVCDAGWLGQFCDRINGSVWHYSHRCVYSLPTHNDCTSPGDKCVPDNLNCVLQACSNGIGWCLPAVAANQIFSAVRGGSQQQADNPQPPPPVHDEQPQWIYETFGGAPAAKSGLSINCQNGGTFHCICPFGFHGDRCGVATNWCLHPPPIISGGHQVTVPVCGLHGTCHFDPHSGSWCVCDAGWTGRFCRQPIPTNINLSHRCHYHSATDTTCPAMGGPQKCVPDNLNCVLQTCAHDIGWCLPVAAAFQMTDSFCQHRTSAPCPA